MKKLLLTGAVLLSLTGMASAQRDLPSETAHYTYSMIFYREVCPYGRVKMPLEMWEEMNKRWTYIPDDTKRWALRRMDGTINDRGIAEFCGWADGWFDKQYPGGDPYMARNERVPEFGIRTVKVLWMTDTKFDLYNVVYNQTDQDYATTEWTCTFRNKGLKVHEEKVRVDNVRARSRVIVKHSLYYQGNTNHVSCAAKDGV